MFRIRRIYDDVLPVNQSALTEVREIFRDQFPDAPIGDLEPLSDRLRNPFLKRFRTILFVAENARHHVVGFAIVLHEPEIEFCYLDFLAAGKDVPGRGIGAALYEFVRDEAAGLGAKGVFFECLPDDADRCANPAIRKLNAARLRFYEQYGARPIVGTDHESAVPGGNNDNLPHLVYDGLDPKRQLSAKLAGQVAQAVLQRKYSDICPPEYIKKVVASFRHDSVKLREMRYLKVPVAPLPATPHSPEKVAITLNDKHDIHHIRERGYVESPVRISSILGELLHSGLIETVPVKEYPLKHILAVHDADFVEYLGRACENAPEGKSVYPYVFPIRNAPGRPKNFLCEPVTTASIHLHRSIETPFQPPNERSTVYSPQRIRCFRAAALPMHWFGHLDIMPNAARLADSAISATPLLEPIILANTARSQSWTSTITTAMANRTYSTNVQMSSLLRFTATRILRTPTSPALPTNREKVMVRVIT